jgi:CRISPR/Cas system-associated exonuclease Cas4 (RecB family)
LGDTIATHKGSAVHEALELYVKEDKDYVKHLKRYYEEHKVWEFDDRKPGRGFPHPVEKNCAECKWLASGNVCSIANRSVEDFEGCPKPNFEDDLKILEHTIIRPDSVLKRKILGAEVAFEKEYEGFKVRGYIDLVTEIDKETLEVRDYKTGNYTKNTDAAFKDLQMRVYSMVAKEIFPDYNYVVMTLDYLRKGPVSVIFSREDDEKTRLFLKEAYGKIETAVEPVRKKSFKCSWCIGYDECGKVKDSYRDGDGQFILPEPVASERKLPIVGA